MDCSTLGFPVLQHLPEFAQTQVHWVNDAIQLSHPLSPLLLLGHPECFSRESFSAFSCVTNNSTRKRLTWHFLLRKRKKKLNRKDKWLRGPYWEPFKENHCTTGSNCISQLITLISQQGAPRLNEQVIVLVKSRQEKMIWKKRMLRIVGFLKRAKDRKR